MLNRIRNLIGSEHWLTDGEHKEAILRNILRTHLPEIYRVGSGFVISENESTGQIDILVAIKSAPTLYKANELLLITPEGVEAMRGAIQMTDGLNRENELVRRNNLLGCGNRIRPNQK